MMFDIAGAECFHSLRAELCFSTSVQLSKGLIFAEGGAIGILGCHVIKGVSNG